MQQKTATLGKSVGVIDAVIDTSEKNRNYDTFLLDLWIKIKYFAVEHEISLEIHLTSKMHIKYVPFR